MHTTAPPGHHATIIAGLRDAPATRAGAASVSVGQIHGGDCRHNRLAVTTPLGAEASTIEAAIR